MFDSFHQDLEDPEDVSEVDGRYSSSIPITVSDKTKEDEVKPPLQLGEFEVETAKGSPSISADKDGSPSISADKDQIQSQQAPSIELVPDLHVPVDNSSHELVLIDRKSADGAPQSGTKLQTRVSDNILITKSSERLDRCDDDDYEDKPIKNAVSIDVDVPQSKSIVPQNQDTKLRSKSKDLDNDSNQITALFGIETSPAISKPNEASLGNATKETQKVSDVNEFQVRGPKYEFNAEPSPCLLASESQRMSTTMLVAGNQQGDAVNRDDRSANQQGANEFRSELRVSTSFNKWAAVGVPTVLDGARVGSTVSVFGIGESGMLFCSMFDDDGLQPGHIQNMMTSTYNKSHTSEDLNNRCGDELRLSKAIPNPVPDYDHPVENAHQILARESCILQLELPSRKTKGAAEKRRENQIEMICLPVDNCNEDDDPVDVDRMKAFGLPDSLWKQEDIRGEKYDSFREIDFSREACESRIIEKARRMKGIAEGQIDTMSLGSRCDDSYRGHATESNKTGSDAIIESHARERDACLDYTQKNVEWVYDEYLRAGEGMKPSQQKSLDAGDVGEVMEMKFDVTMSSDEDRLAFANAQREALAQLLGVPQQLIQILGVKPG